MSFKNIDEIQKNVGFYNKDFSFVKTIGSFINNREFSNGFVEFLNGKKTERSYIWNCLSAIGDEIGDTLYLNVKKFVDFTSNVDLCKVKSLASMEKEYGLGTNVLQSVSTFPVELLSLMDILSIDKKYLFKNNTLKSAFLNDLQLSGVITKHAFSEKISTELSNYFDEKTEKTVNDTYTQLDENKYFQYIEDLYYSFLYGFCEMQFNIRDDKGYQYLIYRTDLDNLDYDERIDNLKKYYNVKTSFDHVGIVNAIENGTDSLDKYQGSELKILQEEIKRRQLPTTKEDMIQSYTGDISDINRSTYISQTDNEFDKPKSYSSELISRYSYYRKKKVLEYVNFIATRYYNDYVQISADTIYDIDKNYWDITNSGKSIADSVIYEKDGHKELNEKTIRLVAKSLTSLTKYIIKFREKIKLQCRKNYMKGTQNLLLYVINEYLVDYATHQQKIISSYIEQHPENIELSNEFLSSANGILEDMKKHSINDLKVIEYWDNTEYFNQKTDTSKYAADGNSVNSRFWDKEQMMDEFSGNLAAIQDFYINTMNLKDIVLSNENKSEELAEFLDAIFSVGADDSYIDNNTGLFTTQLASNNQRYTNDIYDEYVKLSSAYNNFKSFVLSTYEYPSDVAISNQISDVTNKHIYVNLSNEHLSSVSGLMDEYKKQVEDLSSEIFQEIDEYDRTISSNPFYFEKSKIARCYDNPEDPSTYKHDYLIGNEFYNGKRFLEKLIDFESYINGKDLNGDSNITNWALRDTLCALYTETYDLCSMYMTDICNPMLKFGYYKWDTVSLEDEFNNANDFLTKKKDTRLEELRTILQTVREQANDAKKTYDDIEKNFNEIVSQYDTASSKLNLSSDTMYAFSINEYRKDGSKYIGTTLFGVDGCCRRGKASDLPAKGIVKNAQFIEYCPDIDAFYVLQTSVGSQEDSRYPYIKYSVQPYDKNSQLNERINQVLSHITCNTAFILESKTDDAGNEVQTRPTAFTQGYSNTGVVTALNGCKSRLENLIKEYDNITNNLIPAFGGKFSQDVGDIRMKINSLIEYLTNFDESVFNNEVIISSCNKFINDLFGLCASYQIKQEEYMDILAEGDQPQYLTDVTIDSKLSFTELDKLFSYIKNRDAEKKIEWNNRYNLFMRKYDDLESKYQNLISLIKNSPLKSDLEYNDSKASGMVELQIEYANEFLDLDLQYKIRNANIEIDKIKSLITNSNKLGYLDIIEDEIKDNISSTRQFEDVVNEKIEELNFFDDERYNLRQQIFLTYGGREICYYPYYNVTNIAHSSYQLHPYLWNFIQKEKEYNIIDKSFNYIDDQLFEHDKIKQNIDNYYGEFGNSVNKWIDKSNLGCRLDYTGYMSRYEFSDHEGTETSIKSPVIDYDGAVFPPAIDYIKNHNIDECIQSLISGDGDFYNMFYSHLGFSGDSYKKQREYIANQIRTYVPELSSTILADHYKEDVYDIYKYGLDVNQNSYILYKKYDIGRNSFKDRKNTPGELWIRLQNHPIAFPAFRGKYPNAILSSSGTKRISNELNDLLTYDSNQNGKMFYDFDFTKDGKRLFLVSRIKKNNITEDSSIIQNYENPIIHILPTDYAEIDGIKLVDFRHNESQNSKITKAICSGFGTSNYTHLSAIPTSTETFGNYAYLGMFQQQQNIMNAVYVLKEHIFLSGNHTVQLSNSIRIIPIINGNYENTMITKEYDFNDSYNDDICFSYNDNCNKFSVAYISKLDNSYCENIKTGSKTDLTANSDGNTYEDPRDNTMNSHDIFTTNVKILEYDLKPRTLEFVKSETYNMNSDMSFIPQYPGISGEAKTSGKDELKSNGYYNFGLLGKSSDIDDRIRQVNRYQDPYFDVKTIKNDYVFGRAYEDYDETLDNTYREFVISGMNSNSPSYNKDFHKFTWNIDLDGIYNTPIDYSKYNVLMFNMNTLGVNPYLACPINEISANVEITSYNSEEPTIDTSHMTSFQNSVTRKVELHGTENPLSSTDSTWSNHISNISSINVIHNKEDNKVVIEFHVNDISKEEHTFIENNSIKFIIYSDTDLVIFDKYHYFDAYGAINLMEIPPLDLSTLDFGHWHFVYDQNMYSPELLSTRIEEYYQLKSGKTELLKDVQLSDYNFLSDVYILSGRKGLQFMYSEEEQFGIENDNYYFPTLNYKYPKTAGDYITNSSKCKFNNKDSLSSLFNDDNLFIMNLANTSEISSSMKFVEIPVEKTVDDFVLCYEYDTEAFSDGTTVSDYIGEYDTEDTRMVKSLFFTEMYTEQLSTRLSSVITNQIQNTYNTSLSTNVDDFVDKLSANPTTYGISTIKSEPYSVSMKQNTSFTIDSIDLDNLMKLYVNYKKDTDGITLYFNYSNYIESPYVKIVDNKLYQDIIDGTYLKLKPDESGYLNIIGQFRYIQSDDVYGCRNIILATYHIVNVSDNKPKFMITETNHTSLEDMPMEKQLPNVSISIDPIKLSSLTSFEMRMNLRYDTELKTPIRVNISYPDFMIEPVNSTDDSYIFEKHQGYSTFIFNKLNYVYPVIFRFINDTKIKGKYMIGVSAPEIEGHNGLKVYDIKAQSQLEITD